STDLGAKGVCAHGCHRGGWGEGPGEDATCVPGVRRGWAARNASCTLGQGSGIGRAEGARGRYGVAHVVFVGLGFGGLYALRKFLDDRPEGVRVTAIDRRDRFVFTPLLYEYLAGGLDPVVVAARLETLVPEGAWGWVTEGPEGEGEVVRGEVSAVGVRGREVRLAGGRTIGFDVLVLAPGSVTAFHGVKGAEQHGLPFYSFEDAERLRTTLRVRAWAGGQQPACVVGGGVVGSERAFALSVLLGRAGGGERVVV